jgi:fumarylacetoacetase
VSNAAVNATHDPALLSWVETANAADSDFPIQNLPFAVFRPAGSPVPFRVGVGIGDQIFDICAARALGRFSSEVEAAAAACAADALNPLLALGPQAWSRLRAALSPLLERGSDQQAALRNCLMPQANAEFGLPARIGDYTDFYSSIHHATAVGRLFRPQQPLFPNYKWLPIGYHGRASSIGISGESIMRPAGQSLPSGATAPVVGPSSRLDYELELGVLIGVGNVRGTRIPIADADSHAFGLCLLNDWSARDLQAWETQPLGPFLSKSFATTISPWVVTLEALAPYRVALQRPTTDPALLPYLDGARNRDLGAFDIELAVTLETERMRHEGAAPVLLSQSNYRDAYWTVAQLIAHHSVNGCNLVAGDLLGTGTLSGPEPQQAGSLIELTAGGKQPLQLPNGQTRTFLEDGDAITLRAACQRPGIRRLGFGECRGLVAPALPATGIG